MIKKSQIVALCATLIATLAAPLALAGDTPSSLAGAAVVNAEDVKKLMASGAKLFDVRVATEYNDEHIVGAVNAPYKEVSKKEPNFDASLDKFDTAALGAEKSTPVILQCNGPECWKSYKAAKAAIKAGFKKVNWFREGIPGWKAKNFPVEK